MKVKVRYVQGVEGPHIQINDYRICGPKAWGGGNILLEWEADSDDILRAINASQPVNSADKLPPCDLFSCKYFMDGGCSCNGNNPCR